MRLDRLWLTDFRSYRSATCELASGLTVIRGQNGQGKTNLLEAVGYLATRSSFRGAATPVMIRSGAASAVVRGEGSRGDRPLLVEAELTERGRDRFLLNRQPVRRSADLAAGLAVSVFTPEDLALVKGGPAERRRWLDEVAIQWSPKAAARVSELERILRQRGSLLRQVAPTTEARLDDAARTTLEVWDHQLVGAGEAIAAIRDELVARLEPLVVKAHDRIVGEHVEISLRVEGAWRADGLASALRAARADELRRGVTLVGPQRDDVAVGLDGLPARTHASQGEQRSLSLAMRLAAHEFLAAELGTPPVLLLDDVFSELDDERAAALVRTLPVGQVLLTAAGPLPPGAEPELELVVRSGEVVPR